MGKEINLKKVKAYMILNDWSMRKLAEQMGVHHSLVSKVFSGIRNPGKKFSVGLLHAGMRSDDVFLSVAVPKRRS